MGPPLADASEIRDRNSAFRACWPTKLSMLSSTLGSDPPDLIQENVQGQAWPTTRAPTYLAYRTARQSPTNPGTAACHL